MVRRRVAWVLGGLLAAGLLIVFVVIPLVDREMMKVPVTDALVAVRTGDLPGLRRCFTADAVISDRSITLPVRLVLKVFGPTLKEHEGIDSRLRFDGYRNLVTRPDGTVEADFTVWINVTGNENMPYRRVPFARKARVILQRERPFVWRIAQLVSDAREITDIIEGEGLPIE